jgi:WD repeat-containing protein 23
MSSSNAPTSPPADEEIPRTIVYDPNDPFWRDTEDDDDDMDFMPAEEGGSDEEGDLSFHGMYMTRVCMLWCIY